VSAPDSLPAIKERKRSHLVARAIGDGLTLLGGLFAVLVGIADFLGFLTYFPFLEAERIPVIALLLLGLLVMYVVVERWTSLAGIDDNVRAIGTGIDALKSHQEDSRADVEEQLRRLASTVVTSLDGVEVRTFRNNQELMLHLVRQLNSAKESVDDLTWSHRLSLTHNLERNQVVEERYQKAISRISNKLAYREVFIFSKASRVRKLKRRLSENADGYSCAYYEPCDIPLIQYMVIDKKEAFFASAVFPIKCAIRHPRLVEILAAYFDEVWGASTKIKVGNEVHRDEVEKILATYEDS